MKLVLVAKQYLDYYCLYQIFVGQNWTDFCYILGNIDNKKKNNQFNNIEIYQQ